MNKLKKFAPLLIDIGIFIWTFFITDSFITNLVSYGVFFYFFTIIYFIFLRKDTYNLLRVEPWETFLYISSVVIFIINLPISSDILDEETTLLILNSSFAGLPPFILFLRLRKTWYKFKEKQFSNH